MADYGVLPQDEPDGQTNMAGDVPVDDSGDDTRSRPHVVMLVDNVIVGDSRVQKQARAMHERGWGVTLVGRRLDRGDPKTGTLGEVAMRFVVVKTHAGWRPALDRSASLRSPLAYARISKMRSADGLADAAVASAQFRIDALRAAGRYNGARRVVARASLAGARARRRFVDVRIQKSKALRVRRSRSTGIPDRLAARWWELVRRDDAWQRLDPGAWDWESAYGPVVDRLKPDLIHANDHRMLHVAARAKVRAAARGRQVAVVWDAHEWLPGLEVTPTSSRNWLPAQVRLERSFAPYADSVVTVSETLAEILQGEHGLEQRPDVVVNAPLMADVSTPARTLREVVGLRAEIPLLVYSGSVSAERSVDTVVRALPALPDVHFALVVSSPSHPAVVDLLALARELGVSNRVHTAPYVPVDQIVPYLASADVGVHTLLHGPNNEIALPTKFYEYAQARLPVLVTDVKVMAETTRRTGQGEVFEPGDPDDLARAARLVFGDLPRYRKAFEDVELMATWTWEAQAEILDRVYRRVHDRVARGAR
jgi:glycosyltransferase involved in cell wall biosynthesis